MTWIGNLRPAEGRDRIGLMSCDQAASVLYVAVPHRTLLERFHIRELQHAIASAPSTATRADAFTGIDEDTKAYYAVFQHELDHLRRQWTTGAGLLCLYFRTMLVCACRTLVLERIRYDDAIPFPLLPRFVNSEWLRDLRGNVPALVEYWKTAAPERQAVITALVAAAGLRGMEQGSTVADRTLADAAMLLAGGPGSFTPIGVAVPPIRPEIDEWLGSHQLLEHMAILTELCARTHVGASFKDWAVLPNEDKRYRMVMALWEHFFPSTRETRTAGTMRPSDWMTDVYKMYPVEFYAVLDLALWTPYTPNGFQGPRNPLRWEDIQPGHRFLRAIALLQESKKPLTPITAENRESRFVDTQDWLAQELGWASPRSLAAQWLKCVDGGDWLKHGLFVGHEAPIVDIVTTVLRQRLEQPFNLVCSNMSWGALPGSSFALWITDEGDAGWQLHEIGSRVAAEGARGNYYLFRGSELLLFGDGRLSRLAKARREQALQSLASEMQCDGEYFRSAAATLFED